MKLSPMMVAAIVLSLAGGVMFYTMQHVPEKPAPPAPAKALTAERVPPPPPTPIPLRELDHQILDQAAHATSYDERQKDVLPTAPFRLDLLVDPHQRHVDRALVDLDRNGKFDEKWVFFPGGGVKRHVAPKDDEQYTETYVLKDQAWLSEDRRDP